LLSLTHAKNLTDRLHQFLGTKFIELYGERYEIYGISRTDPTHPLDLNDTYALEAAYKECNPDIVIHLAADLGGDAATSENIAETNPLMAANLPAGIAT
jgi:dTDP-4-dehydrorhamnose reductase